MVKKMKDIENLEKEVGELLTEYLPEEVRKRELTFPEEHEWAEILNKVEDFIENLKGVK